MWVGLLHAPSLEECAKTCRKMYLLSRNDLLWRQMYLSTRTCLHPHIASSIQCLSWRQMYFREARARTDGIYICKMSYFRPGMTDGAFFQPVHLVTYYRYLRLYPERDGCAVVLLVTTEGPKTAIELLKKPLLSYSDYIPFGRTAEDLASSSAGGSSSSSSRSSKPRMRDPSFKKTNLFIGKYFRIAPNDDEFHLCLYDPQASHNTLFDMTITINSTKSFSGGGSTSLQCKQYASVSRAIAAYGSPRKCPFDVREWNKFVFSRVKSYLT